MRKILSLLVFQLMVTATMMAQVSYKVTGELPASFNDCTAYINLIEGRNLVGVDSTVVKDGKFLISGMMDAPAIGKLAITAADGKKYDAIIVVEDTPAQVSFADDKLQVRGGRRNQALKYANEKIQPLMMVPNSQELIKEYRDSITTAARRQEIENIFDTAETKFNKAAKAFVAENSDNVVGAQLFMQVYSSYEPEEAEALFAQAGDEFKNNKSVQRVMEIVEKSKLRRIGSKYTDFAQPDKDGNIHRLSEYLANCKYLLVDFWASWCGPCRAEMPNVKAAYDKYHAKGFDILGVSLDNNKEKWLNAVESLGLKWHHVSDLKGWQCEASGVYGVQSIPCTMLVANDGTIVATDLRGEELDKKLAELLK